MGYTFAVPLEMRHIHMPLSIYYSRAISGNSACVSMYAHAHMNVRTSRIICF